MIEKIITFKTFFGSKTQKAVLGQKELTALAIWLVEAIYNPDIPALNLMENSWITRHTDKDGEGYLKIKDMPVSINLKEARELVDSIEGMDCDTFLLADTYPAWNDHPMYERCGRYQVIKTEDEWLAYTDTVQKHSILPIALQINKSNGGYDYVEGELIPNSTIYYRFK